MTKLLTPEEEDLALTVSRTALPCNPDLAKHHSDRRRQRPFWTITLRSSQSQPRKRQRMMSRSWLQVSRQRRRWVTTRSWLLGSKPLSRFSTLSKIWMKDRLSANRMDARYGLPITCWWGIIIIGSIWRKRRNKTSQRWLISVSSRRDTSWRNYRGSSTRKQWSSTN